MEPLDSALWQRLLEIPGAMEGESVFSGGPAMWVNRKQVGHFVAPGTIELRLTRAVIRANRPRLKEDPRVELRKSASDWLILRVETAADIDFAAELAALAVTAHAPPENVPALPPPTGADLERRRRFH